MNLEGQKIVRKIIKNLDKKLKISDYKYENDTLIINVERTNKIATCPHCGKKSHNVHSKYTRPIKDLPIQDYKVILNITTKIFFCKNKNCKTNTFSEKFEFIEKRSRITKRLNERIIETAKGTSVRASKKIINNTLADISEDTILRLIKKNNTNNR